MSLTFYWLPTISCVRCKAVNTHIHLHLQMPWRPGEGQLTPLSKMSFLLLFSNWLLLNYLHMIIRNRIWKKNIWEYLWRMHMCNVFISNNCFMSSFERILFGEQQGSSEDKGTCWKENLSCISRSQMMEWVNHLYKLSSGLHICAVTCMYATLFI